MRQIGRPEGATWSLMSRKCCKTAKTCSHKLSHISINSSGTKTGSERTSGSHVYRRQTPRRGHIHPWARRKPLAWDVTIISTYAESYMQHSDTCWWSSEHGSGKEDRQIHKLRWNTSSFYLPLKEQRRITTERSNSSKKLANEHPPLPRKHLKQCTLFQHNSMTIQWGNGVSFKSTSWTEVD